ncbi:MAG: TetR/AcrR family transcriptional regulator [Sulfurimonas sp.]
MAIIVDKEKKRNDIACACKDILLEYGIKNLTISHIAKTANIGKGTVYEYFKNKEEIVFEIMTTFIAEHEKKLSEIVSENIDIKEKLFHFLYLGFQDENSRKQLALYREFLAISMTSGTNEMIDFNIQCRNRFSNILKKIVKDGIEKGELPLEIEDFISAILAFELGLIVEVHTVALDPKDEISRYLDALFTLIKIKEEK